jgi:hypothetical protein
VDGDGTVEIFAVRGDSWIQRAVAFDHTGEELWEGDAMYTMDAAGLALSDVDNDGDIEVVVGLQIIDASTGDLQANIADPGYYVEYPMPYVTDLDGDGTKEILLNGHVFDHEGELELTCVAGSGGLHGAPIQADGDAAAEMVFSGEGVSVICDDDGTQLWYQDHGPDVHNWTAPPLVADFDGDGQQEVALPGYTSLKVIEVDGTLLWEQVTNDPSGMSGAIAWDMDLDGVDEVLYADQTTFFVFDGRTGTPRIEIPHPSTTMMENPVVADLNGDGRGEILRVQAQGSPGGSGLFAIGAKNNDWPYAPDHFTQYGYHLENVNADLTIPTNPVTSWQADGFISHGQPSATRLPEAQLGNVAVAVTDACLASCVEDGFVAASVQVWSDGFRSLPPGTPVEVWGSSRGSTTLIQTLYTTHELGSGEAEVFQIGTVSQLASEAIWAIVDPHNAVEECKEDDNQGSFSLPGCE